MLEDKDWYFEHEDYLQDLPDLATPDDSDSEGENDSNDEESVTKTHLLQVKTRKKEKENIKEHSGQGDCPIIPRRFQGK